ncbi:M23 family metallopeptidase [Glycomyces tarimensis]
MVAAVAAGSVMVALTGPGSTAESDKVASAESLNQIRASWAVDSVIDQITAERETFASEHQVTLRAAEVVQEAEATKQALTDAAEEAEARAEAERKAAEEAAAEAAERAAEEAAAAAAEEAARPDWIAPSDASVTSYYGQRWGRLHAGLDFANSTGDPIWAIADGTVVYAGWMDGYGNMVVVDHGDGVETAYAHATEVLVSVGDDVAQGDELSLTGSTGNSTGPHLHFEVRLNGEQVDPLAWLEERGVSL